jgi:glycerol-3-phosphate acyltransferase PlsX
LNFVGNIEARALPRGGANVVVCDGFVGNAVLKMAEGMTDWLTDLVREGIRASGWRAALGAWLLTPVFRDVQRQLDPAHHGGALLLGVRGVCVIAHGSSRAPAIASAIGVARTAILEGVTRRLEKTFEGTGPGTGELESASLEPESLPLSQENPS